MKAKCPHCDKGCDKCQDGYMEARFAYGRTYFRFCDSCNRGNGGRIVGPGLPPLPEYEECVFCGEPIRWVE